MPIAVDSAAVYGSPRVLAFDFGSPVASAALATAERVVVARDEARQPPEADLLRLLDELLDAAGVAPRELAGVVALAGPGSFTGVRVACAAAQALAQAWDLPAGGVSTLASLSLLAGPASAEVLAVVDALRGEWFVQRFSQPAEGSRPAPQGEPFLWRPGDPITLHCEVVGYGAQRFAAAAGWPGRVVEPDGLAGAVARAAASPDWLWDAGLLTRPHHLRAPSTTRPRR